eukprot:gene6530-13222_t
MCCATPVDGSWLSTLTRDSPLLRWGAPLTSPPPSFDSEADEVVCHVVPRYGAHNWELSPVRLPLASKLLRTSSSSSEAEEASSGTCNRVLGFRKQDEVYRWFGRLLLEGKVLSKLSTVLRQSVFTETPAALTQMKPTPK